jgi:hypothetical protein
MGLWLEEHQNHLVAFSLTAQRSHFTMLNGIAEISPEVISG